MFVQRVSAAACAQFHTNARGSVITGLLLLCAAGVLNFVQCTWKGAGLLLQFHLSARAATTQPPKSDGSLTVPAVSTLQMKLIVKKTIMASEVLAHTR